MISAWPLRTKLTLITGALLVAALLTSSGAAVMLLRESLLTELDRQIADAAGPMTNSALTPWEEYQPSRVRPTDYYFSIWDSDGDLVTASTATTVGGSVPQLPRFTHVRALAESDHFAAVPSTGESVQQWRIGAFPIQESGSTETLGYAVVALPMTALKRTVAVMTRTVVLVGVAVVFLAGILGGLAVDRSLRDLRRVQTAAHAVASGDLSRRVAVRSPRTEVGQLGESFNSMVAALEEAFAEREAAGERMRRFVSDASHELRTPLASIRGYGELYRMGAVPEEEVPATMARIESEARRMGVLVSDLLALARLDEKRPLEMAPVDLRALASDALTDLGALDPTRPTALVAPEPVIAWGDANRIRQVLMNLVGNAANHTPKGTPVEIEARAGAENAVIKVRDHGPGIPSGESERIFERFYRPDSSRARSRGGTGLGLAIVAGIMNAHGGSAYYEPTPGGGATIVITLPLAPPSE
ncbi:MAG TPA: HAMP domain-containing sensor histidine kinase [Beutenbergiaceae bacterium]|nr:HAMP domain-containing sensor histidine kinase [Beutenbergiaceae bacterium]